MGDSWQVIKQDKELLIFPLVSMICCLLVVASFAIPIVASESWEQTGEEEMFSTAGDYAMLFTFYFCNYFIIIFFNTALIACATIRLQGGDPTVADGFSAAFRRIHLIFGWAIVSATVGMILRLIEERSEWVGRLVAGILGMAWTAVSFLVIPVMVVEEKTPMAALKESTSLLRKTWGEQLISGFSFGLVYFVLAIPAYILGALGVYFLTAGSSVAAISCFVLAVIYMIILGLVNYAQQSIFQAALYFYAKDGHLPEAADDLFPAQTMASAYAVK
jgi:hypothetical protein